MDELTKIDHVAITVKDIFQAVDWYCQNFQCKIEYQDESWAFLAFSNIKLALVTATQHPPHIAISCDTPENFGEVKHHRDGTRSSYRQDLDGNFIEMIHYG